MADNLRKQPKKGILKNSSSFETEEQRQRELNKGTKWDEMNILATHHPKDKDYGHMKIEEPKTPFAYQRSDSGDEADGIDADLLAEKIKLGGNEMPRAMQDSPEDSEDSSIEEETPEERAKRKAFEMKRKHHYNEFAAVKLARKLMEQDEKEEVDDDDDDDENESKITEKIIEEEEKDLAEIGYADSQSSCTETISAEADFSRV